MKSIYSRRHLLRGMVGGITVSMGLPLLESMLHSHGEALANGAPLPKRYGQFYWGAGTDLASFHPLTPGANWTPSPSLQPLQALVADINVISGLAVKFRGPTGHQEGHAAMLAGAWNNNNVDPNLTAVAGPTLDQVVVQAWNSKTAYPSLQVASSQVGYANYPVQNAVSWLNPTTPNSLEYSPTALYSKLFGTTPQVADIILDRKSILDVVSQDLQALKPLLGVADRQRIEAHAEGIRQLELQMVDQRQQVCVPPPVPPSDPPFVMTQEQVRIKHRLFVDMLAIALACDLTRVFSIQYTGYKGDTIFWQIKAPSGFHATTHFSPGPPVQAAVRYIMEDFAYLVAKLKATADGSTHLLQQSLIYATSDLADGFAHTTSSMPVLLAGQAGGALQSGLHVALSDQPNTSNVLLTILRALGIGAPSFGQGPGWTDQVIPNLLNI